MSLLPTHIGTLGQRVVARIIDGIILACIGSIIYYLKVNFNPSRSPYADYTDAVGASYFIRWILYYPLLEANGGTFGKLICRLRTVSMTTQKTASLIQGYKKTFFMLIPFVLTIFVVIILSFRNNDTIFTISLIGFVMQFLWATLIPLIKDKNGNRIHDTFAGITVIQKEAI